MNINEIIEKYNFLDRHVAKEPHIYDVLNEITIYQQNSLPEGEKSLATLDTLKSSRNIRMPFSSHRDKNIEYLIDLLIKTYPKNVKTIISFSFEVDDEKKDLNINEKVEYTLLLSDDKYKELADKRDIRSLENLLQLLCKFRFFNLSKLIKKVNYKKDLTRIIKRGLGRQLFTFKHHNVDKNRVEWAEDYCFCETNYRHVRETVDYKNLKAIISKYSDLIARRLRKFGILNTDFSDYKDSKLDYLFNILLEDMASTLDDRDLVEVKNIHSLIKCLNKVDNILDPVQTVETDIIKFIKENEISTSAEIIASNTEITEEIFRKWADQENLKKNNIVRYHSEDENVYFMDGIKFFDLISKLNQLVLYQEEKMEGMTHSEKQQAQFKMDILHKTARNLLSSNDDIESLLKIDKEKKEVLKKIVDDYEDFNRKKELQKEHSKKFKEPKPHKPFILIVMGFFKSLFSVFSRKKKEEHKTSEKKSGVFKPLSPESKKVYKRIIDYNAPIIPLSDIIELVPENDAVIDEIIEELRENNIKIIVPIYNARRSLYPKRSQKVLVADVEYLLLPPKILRSADTIREHINSLMGYKMNKEEIPRNVLLTVERYLLNIYHQRRRRARNKE